jgi:hypothetical protein
VLQRRRHLAAGQLILHPEFLAASTTKRDHGIPRIPDGIR